jgi:ABC-type glutathione transport system ATPase component
MALIDYINTLRAHDASVAIGLLELVRRADEQGALDRGEWLAAIRAAYVTPRLRAAGRRRRRAARRRLRHGVSPTIPDRYLHDHILPRLRATAAARGLVKVYRKRRVVADVDVEVSQGEVVGLLGPNGAGKTTTFYLITGLIQPDDGGGSTWTQRT